ncbi:MAG: hypothetical protein ACAH24_07455 [Hyphomicrobiaceae bacterium]|jgi:hypothetical protein
MDQLNSAPGINGTRRRQTQSSIVKQNLEFEIERLRTELQLAIERQDTSSKQKARKDFLRFMKDLDDCHEKLTRLGNRYHVYIMQKLTEADRALYFAAATDAELREKYLRLRKRLESSKLIPEGSEDERELSAVTDYFDNSANIDERKETIESIVPRMSYLRSLADDNTIVTIWNIERLKRSAIIYSALATLMIVAILLMIAFYEFKLKVSIFGQPKDAGPVWYIENIGLSGTFLFFAFAGILGASLSAISSLWERTEGSLAPSGPSLAALDYLRPSIGAAGGLLVALAFVANLLNASFAICLVTAVAVGFSERAVFSLLRREADRYKGQIGASIGLSPQDGRSTRKEPRKEQKPDRKKKE